MQLAVIFLYADPQQKFKDCKLLSAQFMHSTQTQLAKHRMVMLSFFSCFIADTAVFFTAFLGPIFVILLFNVVIFVMVIRVLIKHTRNTLDRTKEQMNKKTAIRLLISIAGVMFLFGLTWLFGALTVTGLRDSRASTAFQTLFVLLNAFQGFFIFLFFCVFSKDARESWLELFFHARDRYKSKTLYISQTKRTGFGGSSTQKKKGTASTSFAHPNHTLVISSKSDASGYKLNTDDPSKEEKYTDLLFTSAADQSIIENPSIMATKEHPEVHATTDKNVEVKEKEQVLERSNDSEEHVSPSQLWKEDGIELKACVDNLPTKEQVKSAEMDNNCDTNF